MSRMWYNSFALALILGIVAALSASPARAQSNIPSASGAHGFQPLVKPDSDGKPAAPSPPPALPGAQATSEAAPKTQTDLPPTEALFDAINRGDIASARDAIGRGADLNGHNVLGMSPLDLSVDLSRNDITFLLLSMRGAVAGAAAPPRAQSAWILSGPNHPHGKPVAVAAAKPTKHKPSGPLVPVAARQYAADDPGTPDPQMGFLGFGHAVQ